LASIAAGSSSFFFIYFQRMNDLCRRNNAIWCLRVLSCAAVLRAAAGLWSAGDGAIVRHGAPVGRGEGRGEIFFIPQRPYMVLGSLKDQLLYPTWSTSTMKYSEEEDAELAVSSKGASSTVMASAAAEGSGEVASSSGNDSGNGSGNGSSISEAIVPAAKPVPDDEALCAALREVQLGSLLDRVRGDLNAEANWSAELSLGEQQRIAFARVLLSRPLLVLMDESTSALDTRNEALLYGALRRAGVTCVSVGHRPTLLAQHQKVLLLRGGGEWEVRLAGEIDGSTATVMTESVAGT
jgi:ABC-type uncharacterized transport system fused permease/ATPase subunit